ncbi:MAG TPA: sigma-54 dependent transcriptional regulator [Bryobacteraceae bacterium]|nr:sigma-54 dependent transcriptional regulator [Bryobacteraceae bacterium]
MPARVLVVDDDSRERSDLAEMVNALGFQVTTAENGREALARMAAMPVTVILTDLVMPVMTGADLLRELAARGDRTPTVMLTGFGTLDQAISMVHNLKAFWYLEKPVQMGVLRTLLERAVQQHDLVSETERLARQLSYQGVLGDMVGESTPMKEVFSLIRQVAPTTASVLITGESGTGKELVARAIHGLSKRSTGPVIAVNCAALPETLIESELFGHEKGAFTGAVERRAGCFEQANHGTLLLDEIGDMPFTTQAKLLRVIEEAKVRRLGNTNDIPIDVRVLAATNQSPDKAIAEKRFREDLYYRLNVFHINLPPLRDRKQDIPMIASALLINLNRKHNCRVTHVSQAVLTRFDLYSWPGNVRQLRNVLERAVIMAGEGEIQLRHVPGALVPAPPPPQEHSDDLLRIRVGTPMNEVEEAYIRLALAYTKNNKHRAAELLGISLRNLHNKVRTYAQRNTEAVGAASANIAEA